MNQKLIEACAQAAHGANRAYCQAIGDDSQLPWDEAPDWQRVSAREGVASAMNGASPEQLHEAWTLSKERDGWTYGKVKDAEAKTHPCLVPYLELPAEQQAKDALFGSVVAAVALAIG